MVQQRRTDPGAKTSAPQQQWSQGLYLTAVGIVGAAAQEHFQCTAKVDWDLTSSSVSNVSGACLFRPLRPPPHLHTQQQNKKISIV